MPPSVARYSSRAGSVAARGGSSLSMPTNLARARQMLLLQRGNLVSTQIRAGQGDKDAQARLSAVTASVNALALQVAKLERQAGMGDTFVSGSSPRRF